jgi:hypothetical protein
MKVTKNLHGYITIIFGEQNNITLMYWKNVFTFFIALRDQIMWSPTTSGLYQTKIMVPSMVVLPSKFVYLFAVSLLILYGIILSSSMKLSLHFQDFRKVIYSKLWDCSNLVYGYNTQVMETNRTHTHKKSQKVTVGPFLLP